MTKDNLESKIKASMYAGMISALVYEMRGNSILETLAGNYPATTIVSLISAGYFLDGIASDSRFDRYFWTYAGVACTCAYAACRMGIVRF